jgi:hypothetical protein
MQELNPRGENEDIYRILKMSLPVMENDNLRQDVFLQTARLLRRGRRRRRFGFIGLLVLCYAAGLGTWQVWRAAPLPATAQLGVSEKEANTEVQSSTAAEPVPKEATSPSVQVEPAVPAVVLERMGASLSPERSAAYYRSAGDRYLEVEGDLASAVRCYKRSLDAASDAELGVSTEDNWLLMAMKKARQGEQSHAKSNS